MREILEQCVKLDGFARQTYERLASAAVDPGLRATLETLAREEGDHCDWWLDLIGSYDEGLLPDIVSEPSEVMGELTERWADMARLVPEDLSALSSRELLAIAARLEFFMILPVFGELIDLVEPGQAGKRHAAYGRHLEHLTDAIAELSADDPLVAFMADVLKRVATDNRALTRHATRDALTGLRNRRSLDGQLRQWLAWSQRYARPLGVLLVDLDEFKAINDGLGHQAGDRVLALVADALEGSVRGSDMVARYGGDEFAIIAPEADEGEAGALAERIVTALRELRIPMDGGEVAVSLSVGIAVVPAGSAEVTPETVLSTADRSLYEAKNAGRDRAGRTLLAGPPSDTG